MIDCVGQGRVIAGKAWPVRLLTFRKAHGSRRS